jgi:hypothetical protein
MSFEVKVTGTAKLRQVQKRLRVVGDQGLGKQMGKALREAAKPLQPAVRRQALSAMPSGYGPILSKSLRFRTAITSSRDTADVVIRVYGQGRRERRDVPTLNRGRLRHPLYGNRNRWFEQRVRPGFVDRPADRLLPDVARQMQAVIDYVADQIGG